MIWQEKIFAPNFTSSPQGAKSAKNGHFHPFCPFWDCPRNCLCHQNMYITKTQDSSEKCFVPSSTSGPQGAKSAKNGHFPPVLPVFRLFAKLSSKHVYNQDTWLVRKKCCTKFKNRASSVHAPLQYTNFEGHWRKLVVKQKCLCIYKSGRPLLGSSSNGDTYIYDTHWQASDIPRLFLSVRGVLCHLVG